MFLHKYATRCGDIAEEIATHLSGDEYEDVFDAIAEFSVADWYRWRQANEKTVRHLATATPAQRERLLERVDGKDKLCLVFAASQYCLEAKELLDAVSTFCIPGPSYRDKIGYAHDTLHKTREAEESFWPWGGWPSYRDFPGPEEQ